MKQTIFFLLMFSLFCIGYGEEVPVNSAPVLAGNPEYSAPPAAAAGQKTEPASVSASQSQAGTAVPEDSSKPSARQVYRRKRSLGVKSLSEEPVSNGIGYDPNPENTNKKTVSAGITAGDNTDQLARWRANQPPVRTSLPRVTNFRPASSSCWRSSSCRSVCRRYSGTRTVKTASRCSGNSCGTIVIRYRR